MVCPSPDTPVRSLSVLWALASVALLLMTVFSPVLVVWLIVTH